MDGFKKNIEGLDNKKVDREKDGIGFDPDSYKDRFVRYDPDSDKIIVKKLTSNFPKKVKGLSLIYREPRHIILIRSIIILIPFLLILFIIYSNFISSQEFNYFFDIGSPDDNYLTPSERISEISMIGDVQ